MAGIKETRRQVIESGSPLRHHSLNQKKLKVGNQGEVRVTKENPSTHNEPTTLTQEEIVQKLKEEDLPLTLEFLDQMLPQMVDIASKRISEEEEKTTSVPVRIFRIVTDIQKIYKAAKLKDIHLQMVEIEKFIKPDNINVASFPTHLEHTRYPNLLNSMRSFTLLKKATTNPSTSYSGFYKALLRNLTSPDFSLNHPNQVIDRIKVYSNILADIAITAEWIPGSSTQKTARLDKAFLYFLEELKAPLLKM